MVEVLTLLPGGPLSSLYLSSLDFRLFFALNRAFSSSSFVRTVWVNLNSSSWALMVLGPSITILGRRHLLYSSFLLRIDASG